MERKRMDPEDLGLLIFGLALIIVIGLIAWRLINGNDQLTSEYQKAVVQCVEAGRSPVECQVAIKAGR